METMPLGKAVIVDIDGTIADLTHRLDFIEKGTKDGSAGKDYPAFLDACVDDEPIEEMIRLVNTIHMAGCAILFVTGRSDRIVDQTWRWLGNHGINMYSYNVHLFMRKDGDYRADAIIKAEIYEDQIRDKFNVQLVFEDRNSVVKMWRDKGLICLQPQNGDF